MAPRRGTTLTGSPQIHIQYINQLLSHPSTYGKLLILKYFCFRLITVQFA